MSHTVDSLTVQSRQDDDKRKGSLANQQLQKQGSDKWHPAQTVNSSFFSQFVWNMVPVTLPCFVVRKFVYQVISITGKEMCPPNCYTAEYIRGILSLLATQNHPEKFINTCFDFYFSLSTVKHQHKSKQELDNPLHFLKLAVTVSANFEGIFSFSNCPDQHQGPPRLPLNQYWGS